MIEPKAANTASPDDEEHERALVKAHVLFEVSDGSFGSVDNPTKQGFLALARKGARVWNAWRSAYPAPSPDFSGILFDDEDVNFSGFNFQNPTAGGACVNFSDSTFEKKGSFNSAVFGDDADFARVRFLGRSSFSHAAFGINADFLEANFVGVADFTSTNFVDGPLFDNAAFHSDTYFVNSSFTGWCFFLKTTFLKRAFFERSVFSRLSTFHGALFCDEVNFVDVAFGDTVDFSADNNESASLASCQFKHARFNGATFHNRASFTGRQFLAATDFGVLQGKPTKNSEQPAGKSTIFMGIPDFHGCKFHQDTSFDGAIFKTPLNQEAARAFRTLKLAMEQLKATREEQRFFRLEMKAEHSSLPFGKRWISTLYSLLSDYGFSLWRPVIALLIFSLLFGAGHGLLANSCASDAECRQSAIIANSTSSDNRTSDLLKYTLASVTPVPGLDKMQTELRAPLFGQHGWIAVTAIALEIFHKISALVMTFLFALALRNLFKMKS